MDRDIRARHLARQLDLRFLDHQHLVAAVLSVETGLAPAKALRVVLSGRWWETTSRWREVCRQLPGMPRHPPRTSR
jgi:hypothetical protein